MERPFISLLEHADAEGWASHQAAAPQELVDHFGFAVRRHAGATLMLSKRAEYSGLNRVVGLGVDEPLTPALIDQVLGEYRAAGVSTTLLLLCPMAVDAPMQLSLAERGIAAKTRQVKLWRRADPSLAADTSLRIVEIDSASAALYGAVAVAGYGDPPMLAAGHSATVGDDQWRHFLAFDGDRAVATAALFISGKVAWCGFAATLQSARGRGAHSALLATRVRRAAAEGCEFVVCETFEETPQRPNPSFRNMRRLGFEVAYYRSNYLWKE